jgi:hypothetical protein
MTAWLHESIVGFDNQSALTKDGHRNWQGRKTVSPNLRRPTTTFHHKEFDMRKLTLGFATLVAVGMVVSAHADDSGHASINSLKWQMRAMQPIHRSYTASCADKSIGVMRLQTQP